MTACGRLLGPLLLAAIALVPAGCLVVDARLDEKGGGSLTMKISQIDESGDERIRRELSSPSVKLISASYERGVGTYQVSFTDASKLRTAPLFRDLRVEIEAAEAGARTLSLVIPRRQRSEEEINLPDDDYVMLDLGVTVPGAVVETNGEKIAADKAGWKLTVAELLGDGPVTLRATYGSAAGDGATPP